jgi:hypothetical protein
MNNQRNSFIAVVIVLSIAALAMFWSKSFLNKNNSNSLTPTPTVSVTTTASPSATTVAPTPSTRVRVSEYTSQNGHLRLEFAQPMYVLDYMDSATRGWIVISMNPINDLDPQANGLIVNYETPSIEGKGSACEQKDSRSNSMFGQTLRYCETQTGLSGGYLLNSNAKTEYAFFITAKGVSEKDVYKKILFNGLSFE